MITKPKLDLNISILQKISWNGYVFIAKQTETDWIEYTHVYCRCMSMHIQPTRMCIHMSCRLVQSVFCFEEKSIIIIFLLHSPCMYEYTLPFVSSNTLYKTVLKFYHDIQKSHSEILHLEEEYNISLIHIFRSRYNLFIRIYTFCTVFQNPALLLKRHFANFSNNVLVISQ